MDRILAPWREPIYALARIVFGFLFACHGAQKLFGVFGGLGAPGVHVPLFSQMGLAGVIELVGGTLVALGFGASWAAFVCSGEMAVAYFLVHQSRALLPIENGGELAALFSWIFLGIAARGDGIWSLGALARRGAQ